MVYPHAYRTEHSETHTSNSEYGDYYARMISKKIPVQPALLKLLQFVDSNRKQILNDLNEIVHFKSIWPDPKGQKDITRMKDFIENWMRKIGAKFESFDIGTHKIGEKMYKLPPVILGTVKGTSDITVCIYSNVDVHDPCTSKWKTNPWEATVVGKEIYGNGVVLGKGPLMCWLEVVNAFNKAKVPLPVNVKFIIETMYFNRSIGLKDFLMTQKQNFLNDIDYVVVCDSEWFDDKYPCITYGVVGYIHVDVFITKTTNSGEEPEANMEAIISNISNQDLVTVPLFDKYVTQVTPDEENLYESINMNWDEFMKHLPPDRQDWSKSKLLMHHWRMPTIFVDQIEHCTCEKKDMSKIKCHFVIKLVPKQIPKLIGVILKNHILKLAKNMKNTVEVEYVCDTKPWVEDCHTLNYEAARRATIQIYKEDPSMIRDDKDLKCLNILEMLEKNILLLPLGIKGGNGGEDNEHIPQKNLYEGIKLIAAYLMQIRLLSEGEQKNTNH